MHSLEPYKGSTFKCRSEKLLNGKYIPRGDIVTKTHNNGQSCILKTFEGEYSTKEEADKAFIKEAKSYIDDLRG